MSNDLLNLSFEYCTPGNERLRNQDERLIVLYVTQADDVLKVLRDSLSELEKYDDIWEMIPEDKEKPFLYEFSQKLYKSIVNIDFKLSFVESYDDCDMDDAPSLYVYIQSDYFRQ